MELDSFSKAIEVNADLLKLSKVARNLLNNAVNHTEPDADAYASE